MRRKLQLIGVFLALHAPLWSSAKNWELIPNAGISSNTTSFQNDTKMQINSSYRVTLNRQLGRKFYLGGGIDITQIGFRRVVHYTNNIGSPIGDATYKFFAAKPLVTFFINGGRIASLTERTQLDYGLGIGVGSGKMSMEYDPTRASVKAISYISD
ncbi:MAG: hypothetical protein EBZ77_12755, partial [Chitinophagia bacterium]|nr:hypothetical protein [Chitinophagia bacterium]